MKNNFILLCIGFLIAGCEEVIQLDLPTDSPRLVVEASLKMSPNETITQQIKLSLSGPFYQEENPIVSEAILELIDLSNNIIHEFEYDNTNQVYKLQYTPTFDTDYKIRIIHNDEVYESTNEQLMYSAPIDTILQGNNTLFGGDEKEVLISFTDNEERDDYYLFDLGMNLFLATKDEFYQGNVFTFSYFYDELSAGDEINIEIMGIDERHFNFMTVLIEQTQEGGRPFDTTPSTIRGNISNLSNPDHYPVGYFRLSETFKASLILE
jgi:hypothetical protein